MPYTTHPKIPEVRMEAVNLVKYQGWSTRKAAVRFGHDHSTIVRWCSKKPVYGKHGRLVVPTESSRPLSHPNQLSDDLVRRTLQIGQERHQCAEIIHHRLLKEGASVSLSSVKRTLKRAGCTKFSRWKKWHQYPQKPLALSPGVLVGMDSMLDGRTTDRISAYALVDVCSRWAFASPIIQPNSRLSAQFIKKAQCISPFRFQTVQSDH